MVLIMEWTFREEFEKLMSLCAIFTLLDLEKMQHAGFFYNFQRSITTKKTQTASWLCSLCIGAGIFFKTQTRNIIYYHKKRNAEMYDLCL